MNPTPATLAKKTKIEILSEYEKLLATIDDAKLEFKETTNPISSGTIIKARKEFTLHSVSDAVNELKTTIADKISTIDKKVAGTLDELTDQLNKDVGQFTILTEAIDLSEKRLKSLYNIDIVATTLETLVAEHAEKKRSLESAYAEETATLANETMVKKRDAKREEEEYMYNRTLSRTRDEETYLTQKKKKEEELKAREDALTLKEEESVTLRTRVEGIPLECEKLTLSREQEVEKRLTSEHTEQVNRLKEAWESDKRILDIKYSHLEAQSKKLESELTFAKKEAELAQKKAQELAVTVIENSGGRLPSKGEVSVG